MKDGVTIALAQLNPKVGDLAGNLDLALRARRQAGEAGADAVVFSELFLCGYPPEDLLLRREFQDAVAAAAERLAAATASAGPAMLMGMCRREGGRLYNSVGVLAGGEIRGMRDKVHLPNYGVFDEARLFAPGAMPVAPVSLAGVSVGAPICEDIWRGDVAASLAEGGAEMLLVANGSPFEVGKGDQRRKHAAARVAECGVPLIYVNQVGGQDELVFDGGSFVLNADGAPAARLPRWREAVTATRWERAGGVWRCVSAPEESGGSEASEQEDMYQALLLGLRDYVEKNGFAGVLLGLSGGVDSALVAVLAADALGSERVRCLRLPSRYTSRESMEDAAELAANLGVRLDDLPIEAAVRSASEGLGEVRSGEGEAALRAVTAENLQARMRGLLLMGLSNDTGALLLTTGNKSELSVGYATLYGDMNGGFNPLKDVYKSDVYALCRWRNGRGGGAVIPARVLEKAPSAELREGQRDSDSLPDYAVLDGVLRGLVEEAMSVEEIAARGFAPELVRRVEGMLLAAEYKRRQGAPGVKLSSRHFGRDRRYPITNGFRSAPR